MLAFEIWFTTAFMKFGPGRPYVALAGMLFNIPVTMIHVYLVNFTLFSIMISSCNHNIYDPLPRRMEKIKMDALDALKEQDLSKDEKNRILGDIKVIDSIMDTMSDNYSFYELVWNYLYPWGRKERKEIEFNEDLERMLNNELYGAAAAAST
jgi:hypothetical protein